MKLFSKISRGKTAVGALIGAAAFAPLSLAQIAPPETVETAQLASDAFAIGALRPGEQPLPRELWAGSEPQTLDFLLSYAPTRPATPSLGAAMRRILLSPGDKPAGADASLGGKKLLALTRAGFIDEAQTISSLATSGRNNVYHAEADAVGALLSGNYDAACRRGANLATGREALFWVKLRALCYARAGELDAFDLTVNLLRERGAFSSVDEAYIMAALSGANGRAPDDMLPAAETALHYAAAHIAGVSINPGTLSVGDGGVIASIANDDETDTALRLEAAMSAVAMGVMNRGDLVRLLNGVEFDVTDIANAGDMAAAEPGSPLSDALLFQSVEAMTAPEFIRDKAARISEALSLGDSFHRAYALNVLYANEIENLEGVIVAPEEASRFAAARMAVGDSVGAAGWLSVMIGANSSVAALPEDLGLEFIDQVNLLATLDPQTAAQIARRAGVSTLNENTAFQISQPAHQDPAVTSRVLRAAFDAIAQDKTGQAGLAALAASSGPVVTGGEIESVIVSEGLSAAGMPELTRRHLFERAWASQFASSANPQTPAGMDNNNSAANDGSDIETQTAEGGLTPRLKPDMEE
ncbi:hypothetical protein [Hyphococcus sp.]|uniref:hypothetical protein n=1 Tax=Hyphococcus sp. TaxID=2038636 RepID=UPI003CCC148A